MPTTAEVAMTEPSPQPRFDEAIEEIQNTICNQDQRAFRHHATVDGLTQDLRSMCAADQRERQRLLACTKKMAYFSHAFAPYFEVVATLTPVRPDWLAWFWGSLRLVFKVGRNYIVFLEQVCDMFKAIGHNLPRYREKQDTCMPQLLAAQEEWLVLLSYVYADIVRFCLELYSLFSRSPKGDKLRHPAAAEWRPLDSRFSQLQQRLAKHRIWIETGLQDHGIILQSSREYLDHLHPRPEAGGELEAERMARRTRRIEKVTSWLSNSCAYQDLYDHRVGQRHGTSCSWFLDTTEYCNWKNTPFDERDANDVDYLDLNWHERVLFVQAPPGFGKTFLSTRVIQDLRAGAGDLNIGGEPATVSFFHFTRALPRCTHSADAFRALALQLVLSHQDDRTTLDAISLLLRKVSSQDKASSDDVLVVLSLLLRQHSAFIVVDGVDDCKDVEHFLTSLSDVCRKSDSRVIIFSRPNLNIPLQYQMWASNSPRIVSLSADQNRSDIEAYLAENFAHMTDQGYFQASLDGSATSQISNRANGSFLWASLLLKYLQSPQLSPNERHVSLEQYHHLEGLESLYRLILMTIDRKSDEDRRISRDVFRWLTSAINPLCIPKFRAALSITLGPSSTGDRLPLNIEELVPHVTCGLVEVTSRSVIFADRSFQEYLQSAECLQSDFNMCDDTLAHAHLAARCLSYLASEVPRQPFQRLQPHPRPPGPINTPSNGSGASVRTGSSGDSGYKSSASDTDGTGMVNHAQEAASFDVHMPFLRYAALCWPIHLARALTHSTLRPRFTARNGASSSIPIPWLPALSQFLTERSAVTAWVEASWRYNFPPNLSRLIPLLVNITSAIAPATIEGRELRWVVQGLRQLNDALSELREDFGATLILFPGLVWQGNLHAAAEQSFWSVWDERRGCVVDSGV